MTARTDEQEDAARMRAGFGEALALTEEAMTLDRNTLLESAKKYRKKPIVIEALCWTGTNLREVIDFTGLHPSANKWTWEEYEAVVAKDGFKIFTLEGAHLVSVGDYVIRGVKGEFYACKPDIFAMTYENALAAQQPAQRRDDVLLVVDQQQATFADDVLARDLVDAAAAHFRNRDRAPQLAHFAGRL